MRFIKKGSGVTVDTLVETYLENFFLFRFFQIISEYIIFKVLAQIFNNPAQYIIGKINFLRITMCLVFMKLFY